MKHPIAVLDRDQEVPRKQRHTAKRIFDRMRIERGYEGGYTAINPPFPRPPVRPSDCLRGLPPKANS